MDMIELMDMGNTEGAPMREGQVKENFPSLINSELVREV